GQCNVPAPNADFIGIAGGSLHSLGLKADGSIVAWGYNYIGQCEVPSPNADFIGVAAGWQHSLGLKADGSIVAWGKNVQSQCDVPAPNTDFVALAGGGEYSLGIKGHPRPRGALDIKPGSCPNSFNRKSRGALHVAVCGTETFDVTTIDIASVRLSRADGVGGEVAPHEGPPGPHSFFDDVATPYYGESCHELGADGIVDLQMHFENEVVTAALELDALAPGAVVELIINGSLLDRTPFTTEEDRIRLVPPGGPPGLVAVRSTVPDAWIDAYPLDLQLDDGGFADFERSYPQRTVVTYIAPRMADGVRFTYWQIDGEPQAHGQAAVSFEVVGDVTEATAVFRNPTLEEVQGNAVEQIEMQPIGGPMQPTGR
ncbi:MAG: hypothetical protein JSV19_10295, partial [Phycisphaerales bacterium]